MIEAAANFAQVQMEDFPWYATKRVGPILGIAPKSFDAIQVIASLGPATLFTYYNRVATDRERGIGPASRRYRTGCPAGYEP